MDRKIISHKICFDLLGHGAPLESWEVEEGARLRSLPKPADAGYQFEGWYKDAACKMAWNPDQDAVDRDLILYAKWTLGPVPSAKLPEIDMTPAEGNLIVEISGACYTETAEKILDRLNEIRLEACMEGVTDPATQKPLTEADYQPLQWSADLEAIARLRAAEASVNEEHTRPNGGDCFTAVTENGKKACAENLAWSCPGIMDGIERWYNEKKNWVDKTGEVTVHYENLISTRYRHVAIGVFQPSGGRRTVAQEFSDEASMVVGKSDASGLCEQKIEILADRVKELALEGADSPWLEQGKSIDLILKAKVLFSDAMGKEVVRTIRVTEGSVWSSSDPDVAEVGQSGTVTALTAGKTKIQVSAAGKSTETELNIFAEGTQPFRLQPPVKRIYLPGEELDLTGGKLSRTDGEDIPLTAAMVSGPASGSSGVVTLTAAYGGLSFPFDILMLDAEVLKTLEFTASYGQRLSDITLPENAYGTWSWEAGTRILDQAGTLSCPVTFTPEESSFGVLENIQAKVTVIRSLEGATLELAEEPVVYNGEYQYPEVNVFFRDGDRTTRLTKDADYTVQGKNCLNAGTAEIILTGKNSYEGVISAFYEIKPAPLVITAVDQQTTRKFENRNFTYQISGLMRRDYLRRQPTCTCSFKRGDPVGDYEIMPGNADAGENYVITYKPGTLHVEEAYYTVHFDLRGHGSSIEDVQAVMWGKISPPQKPKEAGYRFEGWYRDPDFRSIWNFERATVQSDMTLYARWTEVTEENRFQVELPRTTYLTGEELELTGGTITDLADPDAVSIPLTTSMVSGFQSETPGVVTMTVTAGQMSASVDVLVLEAPKLTVTYGRNLRTALPYNSNGTWRWKEEMPKTVSAGSHTFDCVFSPWDDRFNARTDVQAQVTVSSALLTIKAEDITIQEGDPVPAEFTYEVSGLISGDRLLVEPSFTCDCPEGAPEGSYTITPKDADAGENYRITYRTGILSVIRAQAVCRVSFDLCGHGGSVAERMVTKGAILQRPEDPTADGYRFEGWYADREGTKAWDFEKDTVQSDLILYARWTAISENPEVDFQVQEIGDVSYTGRQWKPAVVVYDGETLLKAGRDYTLAYGRKNTNVNETKKTGSGISMTPEAGLPYVKITGKGNYTGTVYVHFNILPVRLADEKGEALQGVQLKYTDQAARNDRKSTNVLNSLKCIKNMKAGVDYTAVLRAADAYDGKGTALAAGTEISTDRSIPAGKLPIPAGCTGSFFLEITGRGNYSGTIRKPVCVADNDKLLKNVKITLGKDAKKMEYGGIPVELTPAFYHKEEKKYYAVKDGRIGNELSGADAAKAFTVSSRNEYLVCGRDFEVSYENNDHTGKASLVITGTGNYAGRKSVSFEITGKPFTAKTIDVWGILDKTYTGKAQTQDTVSLMADGNDLLEYGKDYTISYKNNVNRGTATMIFTAASGSLYSGSFKKSFKIIQADLAGSVKWKDFEGISVGYEKAGARPFEGAVLQDQNGNVLRPGKDYTVTYKNNKAVAMAGSEKSPVAVFKGKGNYTGTKEIPFTVFPGDLGGKLDAGQLAVEIAPVMFAPRKADSAVYRPSVKIKEGRTALGLNKDYTVSYENNTQAACRAYLEKAVQGTVPEEERPSVIIKAADGGNYVSGREIRLPLPVYREKIGKKNIYVEVEEAVYTGRQARPGVTVYYGDSRAVSAAAKAKTDAGRRDALKELRILEEGKDYTCSYGENKAAGKNKGSVAITGNSWQYGGSVTVKFTIKRKPLRW